MTNKAHYEVTQETARRALTYIDANDRSTWVKMGAALKSGFGGDGFDLFDQWSETGSSYDSKAVKSTWRGFDAAGGVTIGTLIYEAKRGGFDPKTQASNAAATAQTLEARQKRAHERAVNEAAELKATAQRYEEAAQSCRADFDRANAAGSSPYFGIKGVDGHGVRYEPSYPNKTNTAAGVAIDSIDSTVLVPLTDNAGKLWNLQRIDPIGGKMFVKGARVSGLYHLIGQYGGTGWLLIAEGYATAATLHEVTGYPVAVGFNASVLKAACVSLRARYPDALMLICADNDQATEQRNGKNSGIVAAQNAAAVVGGYVAIPQGLPMDKSDFNDLFNQPVHGGGSTVVKHCIEAAIADAVKRQAEKQQSESVIADGAIKDNETHYQQNANTQTHGTAQTDNQEIPKPKVKPTPKTATKATTTTPYASDNDDGVRDGGGKFQTGYNHFTCDDSGVTWHFSKDGKPQSTFICTPLHVTALARNDLPSN